MRLKEIVAGAEHFVRKPKRLGFPRKLIRQPLGAIRDIGGRKNVLAIPLNGLRKIVEPSAATDVVLDELDKRGLLLKAADGKRTRQLIIPEINKKRARYVCLLNMT